MGKQAEIPESGLTHVLQAGESIESLADAYGHFGPTIWDHPDNCALKELRGNPDVLLPGDEVHIPPLRVKTATASTGLRHRFKRRGVPSKIYFYAKVFGQPLADQPFVVEVDDQRTEGRTTDEGLVECFVRPDAPTARITIGEGESTWEYVLRLRRLEPVTEVSGVQARLANLGFFNGPVDGNPSADLESAIGRFQAAYGQAVTGELDEAGREALVGAHGS